MMASRVSIPRFQKEQQVNFLGGSGTVKSYQPEVGTWTYLVEMEMGPEPEMGRVGSETRVLLVEAEISG